MFLILELVEIVYRNLTKRCGHNGENLYDQCNVFTLLNTWHERLNWLGSGWYHFFSFKFFFLCVRQMTKSQSKRGRRCIKSKYLCGRWRQNTKLIYENFADLKRHVDHVFWSLKSKWLEKIQINDIEIATRIWLVTIWLRLEWKHRQNKLGLVLKHNL